MCIKSSPSYFNSYTSFSLQHGCEQRNKSTNKSRAMWFTVAYACCFFLHLPTIRHGWSERWFFKRYLRFYRQRSMMTEARGRCFYCDTLTNSSLDATNGINRQTNIDGFASIIWPVRKRFAHSRNQYFTCVTNNNRPKHVFLTQFHIATNLRLDARSFLLTCSARSIIALIKTNLWKNRWICWRW